MIEDLFPESFRELLECLPDGVVVLSAVGDILAVNGQFCGLCGYLPDQLVNSPIEMLVPAALRAEHVALRCAHIANGGALRPMSQRDDIVLVRSDHSELPVDIALSTIKIDDVSFVIAAVRDATFRREAAIVVAHEHSLLTAMNHISIALLEGHALDDTFRAIAHHARRLVAADYAMLTIPNDDASALVMRVVDGDGISGLEGSALPLDASMSGVVIRDREPQLVIDASTDARMFRPLAWPQDAGPALFVPMHSGTEILGSLTVVNRRDRDLFTVADITRLRTFAAHVAVALEHTRRQAAIQHLHSIEEDRERVAGIMLDTVIHGVSSAALGLHGLLRDDLPAAATNRLWETIDQLDGVIKAVRSAVFPNQ